MHLCLYQPLIPQNTGNIGRLCVGFNCRLSLIKPLGFSIEHKELKRAGLDYWQHLNVHIFENFEEFYQQSKEMNQQKKQKNHQLKKRVIAISKYGEQELYNFSFRKDDILLMGKETTGIPDSLIENYNLQVLRIPMSEQIRSYNLANSSAMCLGEFYRQIKVR